MEFTITPDEQYRFKVELDVDEAEAMRAAFRERNYYTALANPGSVSDFDASVAEWKDGPRTFVGSDSMFVPAILTQFAERTRESVSEIPAISNVPPFENRAVGRRIKLGKRALKLAQELTEAIAIDEFDKELKALPETPNRSIEEK